MSAFANLIAASCLAAGQPLQVTVVRTVTVAEAAEDLNFPFVFRGPGGFLALGCSIGRHTVAERGMALVSEDDGAGPLPIGVPDVQVGVADPAGGNPDEHLACTRRGEREVFGVGGLARLLEYDGTHPGKSSEIASVDPRVRDRAECRPSPLRGLVASAGG